MRGIRARALVGTRLTRASCSSSCSCSCSRGVIHTGLHCSFAEAPCPNCTAAAGAGAVWAKSKLDRRPQRSQRGIAATTNDAVSACRRIGVLAVPEPWRGVACMCFARCRVSPDRPRPRRRPRSRSLNVVGNWRVSRVQRTQERGRRRGRGRSGEYPIPRSIHTALLRVPHPLTSLTSNPRSTTKH